MLQEWSCLEAPDDEATWWLRKSAPTTTTSTSSGCAPGSRSWSPGADSLATVPLHPAARSGPSGTRGPHEDGRVHRERPMLLNVGKATGKHSRERRDRRRSPGRPPDEEASQGRWPRARRTRHGDGPHDGADCLGRVRAENPGQQPRLAVPGRIDGSDLEHLEQADAVSHAVRERISAMTILSSHPPTVLVAKQPKRQRAGAPAGRNADRAWSRAATTSRALDQIGIVRATASGRKMSETPPRTRAEPLGDRGERADAVVRQEHRGLDRDRAHRHGDRSVTPTEQDPRRPATRSKRARPGRWLSARS